MEFKYGDLIRQKRYPEKEYYYYIGQHPKYGSSVVVCANENSALTCTLIEFELVPVSYTPGEIVIYDGIRYTFVGLIPNDPGYAVITRQVVAHTGWHSITVKTNTLKREVKL